MRNIRAIRLDNTRRNRRFEKLCAKTQKQLKKILINEFNQSGYDIVVDDGFIYKKGSIPILLLAHMDTVHVHVPTEFYYKEGKVSSPTGIGGDDRCGIYMVLEILKKYDCHVLFTEDEEYGGIGANLFTEHELCKELKGKFNFAIELDRTGEKDAVFYDCDNPEFTDFITKEYWVEDWGSYTDISDVCPALGIAGVNLSCGYYSAHTAKEYVILEEMENNIVEACNLIARTTEDDVYEYIESRYSSYYKWKRPYTTWLDEDYDDDEYDDYYYNFNKHKSDYKMYHICYWDSSVTGEKVAEVYARSTEEAVGIFLMDHRDMSYSDIFDVYSKYAKYSKAY